ncbi:uncharacterized protein BT62DRAFT_627474 [Guyanagaster necrorhizus]|uniref:Uncharacterized protein n=1 Tax=Guyanagaster necrorhizus TaxID=856835 RepID=A0A9P7VI05_9AGAR|nr:uncharacterized protein BT62DRAFT_773386 [Guyanagaster necrorhizus MCA 3950]XP_043033794.1 uncharacterized protein BT62DRAFT_627474 [Guyanagaster necrorhizus MCA 3950]KAG7439187.1 hypothetical protein BT62DRAFT_773386 [Guyanagaster necrorhizus MCA 3950]KAG7440294.1 hypothetical protein BT62DRAFT_627474 [Guyanagaster necrorhizus MCA 3950]
MMAHLQHLSLPTSSTILAGLMLPALTTLNLRGIFVDTVISHIHRSRSTIPETPLSSDDIVEVDCARLLSELSALEVAAVFIEYAHTPTFIKGLFEASDRFTALHILTLKGIGAVDC